MSEPSSEDDEDEDEAQDWTESEASETTPARPSTKGKAAAAKAVPASKPIVTAQAKRSPQQASRGRRSTRASKAIAELEQELDDLSLGSRDSTIVIPNKKARAEAISAAGPEAEYVPQKDEIDTGKKKKR